MHAEAKPRLMLRVLTSVLAVGALLLLNLHLMAQPALGLDDTVATAAHMTHGASDRGPDEAMSACAVHCLAAALLPALGTEGALSLRRVGASFEAPLQPAGLSPLPIGPPPKALVFL